MDKNSVKIKILEEIIKEIKLSVKSRKYPQGSVGDKLLDILEEVVDDVFVEIKMKLSKESDIFQELIDMIEENGELSGEELSAARSFLEKMNNPRIVSKLLKQRK